jgi:hypothetical protein
MNTSAPRMYAGSHIHARNQYTPRRCRLFSRARYLQAIADMCKVKIHSKLAHLRTNTHTLSFLFQNRSFRYSYMNAHTPIRTLLSLSLSHLLSLSLTTSHSLTSFRDVHVASAYLHALGGLSHLLLAHPVGLFALAPSSTDTNISSSSNNNSSNTLRVPSTSDATARNVSIRPLDWQKLIGYISQRNNPYLPYMLPRIRCTAESVAGAVGTSDLCDDGLELWAVVEAARLCVRGRLRTSFGGATQTFEALEHMLLEACTRGDLELRLRSDSCCPLCSLWFCCLEKVLGI